MAKNPSKVEKQPSEQVEVIGDIPDCISKYVGPRLELGEILFGNFTPKQRTEFDLGRFGVPDVPHRMCAPDAAKRLKRFRAAWDKRPSKTPKEELVAWLLAIGLMAAHLRDNNITLGGGLKDLLALYEYSGECSQVVRWLRTGKVRDLSIAPVAALDWFMDLVPTVPATPGMPRGYLAMG